MTRLIAVVLMCFTSMFARAGGEDAASSLYELIKALNTLSADFQQTIVDREEVVIQESRGEFSLQRPDKIYWKTLPPYEQEIVGDGSVLWVYDADLEQVTQYDDGHLLRGPMALFSNNIEDITARFRVTVETKTTDNVLLESYSLVPLANDVDEGFTELVFTFKGRLLFQIDIHDRLRQKTVLSLSNVAQNSVLPAARFLFVPPEGVDVIANE